MRGRRIVSCRPRPTGSSAFVQVIHNVNHGRQQPLSVPHFLQNVLSYNTVEAGAAFLPAIIFMVIVAPRSAKLIESRGARSTLLLGYVFLTLAFVWMFLFWGEGSSYWQVGLAYALIGTGVGFAGTPASHSLTGSVPVHRAGMASGTADLQREQRYPSYADQITAAAKAAFMQGDDWAYAAGGIAVVLGAILVFVCFPRKDTEQRLLEQYHAEDTGTVSAPD
jgi:DHA2 family multidrug resistance protein-like MFS transporter